MPQILRSAAKPLFDQIGSENLSKLASELQIDMVSDTFLKSWQNGERPSVSDFASLVPPKFRDQLLRELILTEQQLQIKQSELAKEPATQKDSARFCEKDTAKLQSMMPLRIGPYEPQYVLGRGASGVVYAAVDLTSGKIVAVKVPHSHLVASKEDCNRFLREARNAERLKHSGIVEFLHVGNAESGPYLVYEFLNGIDLQSYLKVGVPLTLDVKLRLIADVARALQYSHDQGLVHRDLKPSNIMVVLSEATRDATRDAAPMQKLEVKILDFGIARLLDAATILTHAGEMLGTPAYMSPEQACGQSQTADHRADIYGLGVILYELLTGNTPFRGTAAELADRISRQEVPLIRLTHPPIAEPVATICQRCLRLNPAQRYSDIAAVAEDIERFLRGDAILAKPIGLWERTQSSWKQNQMSRIAATACAAIVATTLIIAISNGLRTSPSPNLQSSVTTWIVSLPESLNDPGSLTDALSTASVEDLTKLVNETYLHHDRVIKTLTTEQGKNAKSNRLKKAESVALDAVLCLLEPSRLEKSDQQDALASWICERMTDKDVSAWLALLGSREIQISGSFEKVYQKELRPAKRVIHSLLLALIHKANPEKLVSFVDSATPDELLIWSNAIGKQGMERLSIPWEDFDTANGFMQISEPVCVKHANRVLVRYASGDIECLLQSMEDRKDPRIRTYVAHRFRDTGLAIMPLIDRMLDESKPDVLYGLMIVVSLADSDAMEPSRFAEAKNWVVRSYEKHPDSGVHAMCRVLLAKWELQSEKESVDQRLSQDGIVPERKWFVNRFGMHMAIIKGNTDFWMGGPEGETLPYNIDKGHNHHIAKSYAIGMDEISMGLYQSSERGFGSVESSDSPAENLNWMDCMRFCNRLNALEHFKEFVVTTGSSTSQLNLTLDSIDSFEGYRLPESAEWEYASRSNTVTPRFHGCIETPFSDGFDSKSSNGPINSLPNRFGLTNSIGSKSEWSITQTDGSTVSNLRARTLIPANFVVRGGSNEGNAKFKSNALSTFYPAGKARQQTGMRIVLRTPILD